MSLICPSLGVWVHVCECVCLSLVDGGVLFLAYRSIVQYQWEPCLEYGSHLVAGGGQEPSAWGWQIWVGPMGRLGGWVAVVLWLWVAIRLSFAKTFRLRLNFMRLFLVFLFFFFFFISDFFFPFFCFSLLFPFFPRSLDGRRSRGRGRGKCRINLS